MENVKPELARLARLARTEDNLLAPLLAAYQQYEMLDDDKLAEFLRCSTNALPRLALCKQPRPAPDFRNDIMRIAGFAGVDARQLATLIRAVQSRQALRKMPNVSETKHSDQQARQTTSLLLAARDHNENIDSDEDIGETDTESESHE